MNRALCVLASLLSACASPPPTDPLGETASAIIGGVVDPNDPAVVLVIANGNQGQSFCTGEVVSPHVVLSAAHCVDPALVGNGNSFDIFIGSDYNNVGQQNNQALYLPVRETHFDQQFDPQNLQGGHDVSVLVTSRAFNMAPLPMNRVPLTNNDVGATIRLIGYGITSGNDQQGTSAGTRRQTSTTISDVYSALFDFTDPNHNTCEGDSGGPAMMARNGVEVIAGITSFGDQGCVQGGVDTRVDVYASNFVDPYIQANDPQQMMVGPPDMAQSNHSFPDMAMENHANPNPDLATRHGGNTGNDGGAGNDPPAGSVGAVCHAHADCQSGVCAFTDGDTGYCTAICDPNDPAACPDGLVCGMVDGNNYCVQSLSGGRGASGGCNVVSAGSGDPGLWLVALFLPAILVARRKRHTR